ncbi:MAG: hypothetical protein WA634_16540 [Silvibacterium sp.]
MQGEFIRWKDRDALMLNNGSIRVVVLAGGGHLAELRIMGAGTPSPNLLWEAPWVTADPGSHELRQLGELYGGAPTGPFLAGYTGHTLCLDTFGLPSQDDAARGIPLHGEAPARMWDLVPTADGCTMHVKLPVSHLAFSRTLTTGKGQSFLFVEEQVENTGVADREVHWVQHVSLGPPLFGAGNSFIEASVDRCRTWPLGYEGKQLLSDNVDFAWPSAPTISGETMDLRIPFQHERSGFLVAARVELTSTVAYVAALNLLTGFALVYCFRREDFPWVAIWEENCARISPPWNGSTQVRGMEFGTSPMPLGREAIHKMGALFDTPVSCLLSAGEKRHARYAICAVAIPAHLRAVDAIGISERGITLTANGMTESVVIAAEGVWQFLTRGHNNV